MTTPAETVIDKFGGLTGTATAIGVPISTVQGWKIRGRIPQDHWRKLMDAAKDRGETLNLTDFVGFETEPASEKAGAAA
jgi:hypothetical protein